jgi:hypothetical protein
MCFAGRGSYLSATRELDSHAPAFEEAIANAGLSGHAPRHGRLVGMAGTSFDWVKALNESARTGMAALESDVLVELASLRITVIPRARPARADIWWERLVTA